MEITSTKARADLQAVLAAARKKSATKISPNSQKIAEVSVKSGNLVDKLYGNSTKKQEVTPIRVGSRFDAYA